MASGASVSASEYWFTQPPENAVDGDSLSSWSTESSPSDEWFQIDTGASRIISQIKVVTDFLYSLETFTLKLSVDGETWSTIGDYAITNPSNPFVIYTTGSWRYVRFDTMNSTSSYIELVEIEVIGGGVCIPEDGDGGTIDGSWDGSGDGSNGGYGDAYGDCEPGYDFVAAFDNLALGGNASASEDCCGQDPGNAIDGNTGSAWSSGVFPTNVSFDLDLGQIQTLSKIRLLTNNSFYLDTFDLKVSQDMLSWTALGSHSITDYDSYWELEFSGNYRYVRLENMNTADSYMEINELEVIGGGTCVWLADGGNDDTIDAGGYTIDAGADTNDAGADMNDAGADMNDAGADTNDAGGIINDAGGYGEPF